MVDKNEIHSAAVRGLDWLRRQEPASIKDLSRSIQALSLWNESVFSQVNLLLSMKKGGFWETDTSLLDTSRACSALAGFGIIQPETIEWIVGRQKSGNWSDNEIDTAYALIALADCGVKNEPGCEWLINNYGEKWEHVGTTSLIITALFKQDRNRYRHFIKNRAGWILSKRELGGWTHIATSNLAIQALILAGVEDIEPSIMWLLGKQETDNWGNITSTSLSLISLAMYLDKLNSISDYEGAKER